MTRDRTAVALARVAWLSLPVGLGALVSDALDGPSHGVRVALGIVLWGAWAAGVVACLVPTTVSLTALRLVAPGAAVVAVAAACAADAPSGLVLVAGLLTGGLAAIAPFAPEFGAVWVQGSAYGSERRIPLRVPGFLLLGVLPLVWAVFAAAVVAGPALLGARQWVMGAAISLVGTIVAGVIGRAAHKLSRRWLVLVPAGLVVHDHLAMGESLLVRLGDVVSLAPAPADTTATDLTVGALGLALELRLREPLSIVVRSGRQAEIRRVDALLVTPTRPGVALDAARAHGVRRG